LSTLLLLLAGILALLGTPLFIVIFVASFGLYTGAGIDISSTFAVMGDLMEKSYLLPIPMFTLAGFMLAESNAPRRLVRLADALMGWLPGGLAIVTVCTLAFFTTFTGASGVTIIALGGLLWPLLAERGYPERFSLGTITASGSIGLLFFPSLPVFLYITVLSISTGGRASVTPEQLFMAGLIPGTLMVGLLALYAMGTGIRYSIPTRKFDAKEALVAFKEAFWEATLPVWIVLLLQSGQIGLPDISVVTVVYMFLVQCVFHRDIHITKDLPRVISDAMTLVGAIAVILAIILGFNNYLIDQEIPQKMLAFVREHVDSKLAMLLALNIFLLIVGAMMDIFSALVAVLPLLIPLAEDYGIHPLHFGVIFLANLEVGYLTPPVGMNLFISGLHFKKPILEVARSVIPFMGLLLVAVLMITYIPSLSLWVPHKLAGVPMEVQGADRSAGGAADDDDVEGLLDEMEDEDLDQYLEEDDDSGDSKTEKSVDDLLDEMENEDLDQNLEDGDPEGAGAKPEKEKSVNDLLDEMENEDLDQYLEKEDDGAGGAPPADDGAGGLGEGHSADDGEALAGADPHADSVTGESEPIEPPSEEMAEGFVPNADDETQGAGGAEPAPIEPPTTDMAEGEVPNADSESQFVEGADAPTPSPAPEGVDDVAAVDPNPANDNPPEPAGAGGGGPNPDDAPYAGLDASPPPGDGVSEVDDTPANTDPNEQGGAGGA
jgi:tripartite ATP-independent transporter DctM subunit